MSIDALRELLQQLDHMPIEQLNLSEKAISVLKWHGITCVLACIEEFYLSTKPDYYIDHPCSGVLTVLFEEVKLQMIAAGYRVLVLDADVWKLLSQRYHRKTRIIVHLQDTDRDLYDTSFEGLGLSDAALRTLQQFGMLYIGQYVGFLSNPSKYTAIWLAVSYEQLKPLWCQYDEVQPRLIEHGYWRFFQENID